MAKKHKATPTPKEEPLDPLQAELLNDIYWRIVTRRTTKKDLRDLHIEAATVIVRLRGLMAVIAPPGSKAQDIVRGRLTREQFNQIYWDEHVAAEKAKISAAELVK